MPPVALSGLTAQASTDAWFDVLMATSTMAWLSLVTTWPLASSIPTTGCLVHGVPPEPPPGWVVKTNRFASAVADEVVPEKEAFVGLTQCAPKTASTL